MSSTMEAFEILPLRSIDGGKAEEIRHGGGAGMRMGAGKRHPSGATGSKRMLRHGPWPPHRGAYRHFGGYAPVWGASTSAADNIQAAAGYPAPSEQVRWVQFALNQIMNANLPTDGIASPEFRAALREFQAQQGLPVSGFVGPDTISALTRGSGVPTQQEYMLQPLARDLPIPIYDGNDVRIDVGRWTRPEKLKKVQAADFREAESEWWRVLLQLETARPYTWSGGRIVNPRRPDVPVTVPRTRGLYRITFGGPGQFSGREKVYHGMGMVLADRIAAWARGPMRMGLSIDGHEVRWLELPHKREGQIRALEAWINSYFLHRKHRNNWLGVTNAEPETEVPTV